jgi:CDP-glucose 4,6-dehydratase
MEGGGAAMSFWQDRSVLVTGATGLLGSAMTATLLERGARPVCLVRDWVPESELVRSGTLERCRIVRGELEDLELLLRALNEYEVDTVFHLGAQAIVGTAARQPLSTFESNIRGTYLLLEACRLLGPRVRRVIVASSDKAYGSHDQLPYTEDMPLIGRFPYDVSKSCTDLLALSYFHSYALPVAITRCGNLFGPGDLNFNRLVPGTIRSALLDEDPIIRSDGTYVRDYFYVQDAVEAYLLLAERVPEPGFVGEAFNFGTETPLTVLEMVARILRVLDKTSLTPQVLGEASREIPRQFLDCAKARTRLGWRPRYSLEAGLLESAQWYRAHLVREGKQPRGIVLALDERTSVA